MATHAEKLAQSLERLSTAQQDGIVRSSALTRTHLERLIAAGFLEEVLRGWYFVTTPSAATGSTAWYGHYWSFVRQYLADRFGEDYCLHPEASLRLLTGALLVPRQLIVLCRAPSVQMVNLPLGTSLYIYQETTTFPDVTEVVEGIRVMPLAQALGRLPESFYQQTPEDAAVALRQMRDVTPLLRYLLEQGRTTVAGRLAGAFRHIGESSIADRIVRSMKAAGHDVREQNPFVTPAPAPLLTRTISPHVARLEGMWASLRGEVASVFPAAPGAPNDTATLLAEVDEQYVQDAYHSLSIEGYQVSPELIERVRRGDWKPDTSALDRETSNALAARGYLEAFTSVKQSISHILAGQAPADVLRLEHGDWYQALFAPSVRAGLLPAATLAGYRSGPVFIRGSRHVPLPASAVSDAMDALWNLIAAEDNAAVRAVLGHFLFGFIHPYADGNGRMARFLMNTLFTVAGYPWTIVHLEARSRYMEALEAASVDRNIRPFAECIRSEMPHSVS